ncbi:two-component system sensor histidine kinase TtrS [Mesocricetibacter intestinalis]|uniref:histidine kinase n=1 Tax=Mesocricetibacter intestinalis TaxID=1521930 RepID=A0A4R6VHW9_9PAST|nr:PhnD/SsuA/transferrin family substrate-binding protein [Mesocricetibacter intestinalis]TDQ57964.1 two-component system sensor histidine kinase TtrS [Mesocricetibacter intestinalis]
MRFLLVFLFIICCSLSLQAQTWRVGVHAQRGNHYALQYWQPWINWLNERFPDQHFLLIPLGLNELKEKTDLDFVLTNQSQFFYIRQKNLRWLATLDTGGENRISGTGSTIWVKNDSPYMKLADLKNKTVSAVDEQAFGGFLLGYYEFFKQNIRQNENIRFQFSGFPVENSLFLLRDDKVDAAIIPLCLMEELSKEKRIEMQLFRPLNLQPNTSNCALSSELLPNWSLAALSAVPDSLAIKIANALLTEIPAHLPQWHLPLDSFRTDFILRELYRHPQQKSLWENVQAWIVLNRFGLLAICAFILLNYAWISYQVHRKSKALKQTLLKMQQYQQQLIKADRLALLGEMTSGVAHEIKQPLSAIRMYAEGIKHQNQNKQQQLILDKIIEQVDRSVKIMRNIQDWVKNRDNGDLQQVRLNHLIHRVIEFVSPQNKRQVKIELRSAADYRLQIKATALEQVVANCLLNALQTEADLIKIRVFEQQGLLHISICDNGAGFRAEHLDFPFVPFRTDKPQGLGLGLVLCKRLMQSLGGTIRLGNTVSGAEVVLSLPLNSAENNHDHSYS